MRDSGNMRLQAFFCAGTERAKELESDRESM